MDESLFVTGESLLNDRQDGMVERITRQSKKRLLESSTTPSSLTTKEKRQTQKRKQRSPKDEFNPYVKMMRLGPKQMNNVLAYDTDEDRDQRDEAYEGTSDTEEMSKEVEEIPTSNSDLQDEKSESDMKRKSVETTSKASVSCDKTVISKMSKEKLVIEIAPLAKASREIPASSGKTAAVKRKLKEKLVLEIAPVSKASTEVTTCSDEPVLDKVKSKECAVTASSEVPVLSDMVTSGPNEKLDLSVAPMAKTSNEVSVPKNNVKKLALFWEDFTVKAKVKAFEPKSVSQETSAAVTDLELVAQPDSTTTDQDTAQLPVDTSRAAFTPSEHESDSVSNQSCTTPNKMTPNKKTMPGTPKSPKEVLQDYTKTVQIAKTKSPVTSKSSKSSKGLDVTEESPGKWGKKSFRRLFQDPLLAESSPEVLESQSPMKKCSGKKRSLMSLNPAVYSQFFSPPPNEGSPHSTTEIGNSSAQARSADDESFVLSEVTVEEPIGGSEITSCNDSLIGLSVDVSSAISNTSRMDSSVLDNSTVKRAISEVITGVLGDDMSVAVTDSSTADECHVTANHKKTVSVSPDSDSSVDSPDLDSSNDDPPPLYPAINKDDILPPALSPHPPMLEKLYVPQGEKLSNTTSRDDASSDDMPDLISPLNSLKPPILSPHPAGIEILKKTNLDKQMISKSSSHSQVQESQHPAGESGMRDKTTPVDTPVLALLTTYDTTSNTDREPVETAMDLTCYENHDKENIPTTGQSQEDTVSQPMTSKNSNQASSDNILDSEQSETESQFSPSYLSTSQLLWSPTPVLDQSSDPQVLTNRKSVKRPRKLVFDDVLNQEESHIGVKKLKSAELRKPDKPKRTTVISKTSSIGKLALILSPTKTHATGLPTLSTNSSTCAATFPVHCLPTSHQVPSSAGPLSSTPVIQTFQRRIYEPKSAQPAPSATSTPLVQSSRRKLCEPKSAQPAPSATSAPSIKTFQRRIYEPKSSQQAATSGSSRMTERHDNVAEQTDQVFFGASFKPTITSERNSTVFWKQYAVESLADLKAASCKVDAPTVQASGVLDRRITPEGSDNVRKHSSSTVHSQKSTVGQQPLQTSTPISSQNSRTSGFVQEIRPVTTVVRVNAPVSTYQLASQGQNIVPVASRQEKTTSASTYQPTNQDQNRIQSSTQRVNTPIAVYQRGSQVPTMVQSADQRITASLFTFKQTSQVTNSCSQQVNHPVSASQIPSTSQGSLQTRPVTSQQTNPHKEQQQTKTFSLFDHVTNIVQERLSKQLKQRQTLLYNDVVLTDMRSQTKNIASVGSVYSGSSQPNYLTAQTDSAPQFQQNYPRTSLENSPDVQPHEHLAEGTTATSLNFNQNLWQPHRQVSPFVYESSVCSRMQNLKPYTISGWISPSYLQALMQKTDLLNDMFSNALDHKGDVKDWVVENCRKSSPAVLARDLVFRIITLGKLERAVMLYNNMNCLPRSKMAAIRRCILKQFPREFDETIWRKKCLPYVKASVKVLLKHRVPQVQKYWLMNDSSAV